MFYQVTADDIADITAVAGGLIGDLMPVIGIVLGVSIAMLIYEKFFHK